MFAKNIVSGAFRSLHCLIYKVLARPPQRRNVLYLTTSFGFCQALFSTFSKFFRRLPRLSAALSDSPSSISELPEFVKHFFHFVEIFFALSLARPPRFRQLAYYTRPFPFCQHFFPSFCRSFIFLTPAHQPAASPLFFPIHSSMPLGTKRMVFRTFYGSHCLSFLYTFIITSCILSLIF